LGFLDDGKKDISKKNTGGFSGVVVADRCVGSWNCPPAS
jgi:hypothetical protein